MSRRPVPRRTWLVSGALIAVAAACAEPAGDPSPSTSGAPSAVPSGVPSLVPSNVPSNVPSVAPSVVPAAALLQPADLRGAAPEQAEPDLVPHLRPPRPCATGGPSDALRLASAAIRVVYSVPASGDNPEHPTVLFELVMRFRADGAARYLAELRDEVARCRSGPNGRQWTVKDEGIAGESILVTVSQPEQLPEARPVRQTFPVLVARTGDAVVVLAGLGWEFGDGDERLVRALAAKAVERARANT